MTSRRTALLGLMLLLLAACAPVVEEIPTTLPNQPADFPAEVYTNAVQRGMPVYQLDASRSIVVVRVYRGGRFAHLGHDHVVASRLAQGWILWTPDWRERRADLFMPLESLTVDEAELRRKYALTTQPSERDIAGTRDNMLNKTLQVDNHPFAILHLKALSGTLSTMAVRADLTLNGVTRTKKVDVAVKAEHGILRFSGAFSLLQTEFGLEPYSILGGLLQVEDPVDISFELTARRL